MRLNFHRADFDALAAAWNAFFPSKYAVDAAQLRLNSIESPVMDWGASSIDVMDGDVQGFVIIKRSASPSLYPGQSIDQAHVSAIAYREAEIGIDLLADAKLVLRNRGINKLIFGADSRHFFPGCPCDVRTLCDFLMVEGFERGGEAVDLECDLSTYKPIAPVPEGYETRPLQRKELEAFRTFMEREFPGRWTYDTFSKIEGEGSTECVYAAFRGDEVTGFALIQDWKCKQPIGGGVWHRDLGENWGALGPIGVSKDLRGKGLGHGLLAAALAHQRDKGVHKCIIDWTGLKEFYGRHGFETTRTYLYSWLKLSE